MIRHIVLVLLALSLIVPVCSFPTLGEAGREPVFAWEIVQDSPYWGLALLAPLFSLMVLRLRARRAWSKIAFACVPFVLTGSAFAIYLASAQSFSVMHIPVPILSLLPVLTCSSPGIGCWAFVTANGLLLVIWGGAARRHFDRHLCIDKAGRWV